MGREVLGRGSMLMWQVQKVACDGKKGAWKERLCLFSDQGFGICTSCLYRGKAGLEVAEAQHMMGSLDLQGAAKDIEASVNWLKANVSQNEQEGERKALTEMEVSTKTLTMVLRSERELLSHKDLEEQLAELS
ncbi:hypothetical protein BUALT_Bualt04G0127000 [Buddleja alternifolia]|uniref:Uncharacterized protein n=1 Tax=Buddleja alternifolia TaxID=168488 RepID=A0AAV6XZP9_9LAMI|nr:hypothetical protein BUALT_Bualt04G0127000 [Buddleja alternifolia]